MKYEFQSRLKQTGPRCYFYKSRKSLGIILDLKLTFEDHYEKVLSKSNKIYKTTKSAAKRSVHNYLQSLDLILIRVMFFLINLLSLDVMKNQNPYHTITGTSNEKLYQELGLESLQLRHRQRKLCLSSKINLQPIFFQSILARKTHCSLRKLDNSPSFNIKHNLLKSLFPSTIIQWNKLDVGLRKCDSLNVFKKEILKFMQPSSNSFYNCHNPIGMK